MKKLLLFSLLSMGATALAINPLTDQNNPIENEGATNLILEARFGGDNVPTMLFLSPAQAGNINHQDAFGRTAIWYAAATGKNILYDALLSEGADATITSTKGLLAGKSAEELHDMNRDEVDALLELGAQKAKL